MLLYLDDFVDKPGYGLQVTLFDVCLEGIEENVVVRLRQLYAGK